MYRQLLSLLFLTIFVISCGGGNGMPDPEITGIQPDSGPAGTAVTISGKGFSPKSANNSVSFNGAVAQIISAGKKELRVTVPEDATSGAISVTVGQKTVSGPNFTVEADAPGISSVSPDSGYVGDEITITGMNFSATASENAVSFNGLAAEIKSASETQLVTEVPDGATDGPVSVTVNGEAATGPDFDVITTGTLKVSVTTEGQSKDEDGYTLTVDADITEKTDIADIAHFKLEQGNYDVKISGMASNCSLQGDNPYPFKIIAGDTTTVSFEVTCKPALKNKIVFTSDRSGSIRLFVMNADGSDPIALTDGSEIASFPVVSPNGTKIAYMVGGIISEDAQIHMMNADGTGDTILTDEKATKRVFAWSPDGSQIAFTSSRDGDLELYILNIDESNLVKLTDNDSVEDFPTDWSSDGQIIFISDRDGDNEIFVMNADGTEMRQLTDNTTYEGNSKWSPDGSKIAFISNRDGDDEIYVMNADGKGLAKLTDDSKAAGYLAWSPDGSQIAFGTNRDGNTEIYVINADGSGIPKNLTNHLADDAYFDWSPLP